LALAEGDAADDRDDLPNAKDAYGRALRLAPGDPAPHAGLARVELAAPSVVLAFGSAPKNQRLLALVGDLATARSRSSDFAPLYREEGKALLVLGRGAEATERLTRAVELAPNDLEAVSTLAVVLMSTGQSALALPHLRHAVALAPNEAAPLTNLGTALLLTGDVGAAAEAFEKVVALEPNDARAHSDFGTACLTQGRIERAVSELTRATELDPARATYRSNLAHALELAGRLEDARASAKRATELDPKLGAAWINAGTIAAKQKRYADARAAFQHAAALDPTDPRPKANLEELEAVEGKPATPPDPRQYWNMRRNPAH
ncbi:MAG TPA: tetratricopeptide repeat protein, partial [Polyangiaceae bacterium]|nr:tetratricopeptide repeat protein [Polyangiaceae bacterium]